ncbi:unnamed protein product [Durusdinium trenchii]|uniref:Uncharacterized protein n=1 Tax=Durusdinium trenchii TaxID=1381693 RepID=A0ABP0JIU8_9DINO
MPVPWSTQRRRSFIRNVADRGLRVRQLWDLTIFLKRLCKTRSLLNSKHAEECGPIKWLDWQALNLYNITDEVIKKYIPYHDRQWEVNEEDPEVARRYSWAELVSAEAQPPQLMVSHWWGGRFSDFMLVVDRVVEDRALSICTSLWVCTFANNQFGESFGSQILETPFVRAIEYAEATILIVDRDAGSLTRSWCCLELHCTILKEKELQLYTSNGQVGSSAVSSGPLVDAISRWDVRKSEAAEQAYKRQILNFIADVPETHGLRTDCSGNLCCIDGRPQLEVEDDDHRPLLHSHGEAFETLNMDIRVSVLGRIGQKRKATGCKIPWVGHRGITLGQLRTFARKAQRKLAKEQPEACFQEVTVEQICRWIVQPETSQRKCSYAELVADAPQIPDYCINYQFGMAWCDVMSSIEWFAEALSLKDTAVLWFSLMSYNQQQPCEDIQANCYENGRLTVDKGQSECHSFLIAAGPDCWHNIWRLYSLECATRLGQDVYMACSSGVMACTKLFPDGHSKFGVMDRQVTEAIYHVDVKQAAARASEKIAKDVSALSTMNRAPAGKES